MSKLPTVSIAAVVCAALGVGGYLIGQRGQGPAQIAHEDEYNQLSRPPCGATIETLDPEGVAHMTCERDLAWAINAGFVVRRPMNPTVAVDAGPAGWTCLVFSTASKPPECWRTRSMCSDIPGYAVCLHAATAFCPSGGETHCYANESACNDVATQVGDRCQVRE